MNAIRRLGIWIGGATLIVIASTTADLAAEQKTVGQFLAEKRNATMATIRQNGTSQLTPVWFYWDGKRFYVSITRERVKYKNLKRDPRLSLCIDDVMGHAYVVAEGTAQIQEEDIWDNTRRIVLKYRGEADAHTFLERLKTQARVVVILKPERMEVLGLSQPGT